MNCPYADCNGEVTGRKFVGHCRKCAHPVQFCLNLKCNTANRAFSRYCRKCGERKFAPNPRLKVLLQQGDSLGFADESRSTEIMHDFWTCPVVYQGYLWALSVVGVLWRLSPFDPFDSPDRYFTAMGDGFGRSPFIIRELSFAQDANGGMPYLLALSDHSIRGVNLLTKASKELLKVSSGESILSSFEQGFVTLEIENQTIYFLKQSGGQVCLSAYELASDQARDYSIGDPGKMVGPFKVGSRIVVYSRSTLHVLEGGEVRSHSFPESFSALTRLEDVNDLQRPFGQLPVLTHANSAYIPGAAGREARLLYVTFDGASPTFTALPVQGETYYSQDGDGRAVLARNGDIAVLEGAAVIPKRQDAQLSARFPAYHDPPLMIGFAKRGGGVESLRAYINKDRVDFQLAKIGHFSDSRGIGFFVVAGALVFAYLSANSDGGSHLRLTVWDI